MVKLIKCFSLLFCILLLSCTRVNQQNFDRIQTGMTMEQVVQILGKPVYVTSINVAGASGTSAKWESKDSVIFIQFFNNKVKLKTFNEADVELNSGKNGAINNTNIKQPSQRKHVQINLPVPTDTIDNQNRL